MMASLVAETSPIIRSCRLYLYEEMDKSPPTLARTAQALDITERTLPPPYSGGRHDPSA